MWCFWNTLRMKARIKSWSKKSMDALKLIRVRFCPTSPFYSFLVKGQLTMARRAQVVIQTSFRVIFWKSCTQMLLRMARFLLLKNIALHLKNRHLRSFLKLYCECTLVPYNLEFRRNAQMVSCLSNRCQLLWCPGEINPLQFQNRWVWCFCQHPTKYFQAWDLCARLNSFNEDHAQLWQHRPQNANTSLQRLFQMF